MRGTWIRWKALTLNTVAEAIDRAQDLAPWTGFDGDLFLVVGADGITLYY